MTSREIIHTEHAPQAVGPYSQAIASGDLVFTAGQVPLDPATGKLVDGDIAAQTRRVCDNLAAVLKEAGCSLGDVIKTTIFLADMDDFAAVNAAYAEYFGETLPARSTVQVSRLPLDARVEIDAIARHSA